MAEYQGFPSRNQWNVSLWINNEEVFYRLAVECLKANKTKRAAARQFMRLMSGEKTPDGGVFNVTAVLGAMQDM